MTDNPFTEKGSPPTEDALAKALGRSWGSWTALEARLAEDHPPFRAEWKFYSAKSGWQRRLLRKKRTILWLSPRRKHFLASTAFGEKAADAAAESDLPEETKRMIGEAPRYAEGRAVRTEVRTRKDVDLVRRLAAIKMAN
jgi:hypothetical protein